MLFISCSSSNSEESLQSQAPTNLVGTPNIIKVTAQNPNGDGSGTVDFTIFATNATSYKVLRGNGETKEITNGSFTYTIAGSNTYVLYVSAYNAGKFVSTSRSIPSW